MQKKKKIIYLLQGGNGFWYAARTEVIQPMYNITINGKISIMTIDERVKTNGKVVGI